MWKKINFFFTNSFLKIKNFKQLIINYFFNTRNFFKKIANIVQNFVFFCMSFFKTSSKNFNLILKKNYYFFQNKFLEKSLEIFKKFKDKSESLEEKKHFTFADLPLLVKLGHKKRIRKIWRLPQHLGRIFVPLLKLLNRKILTPLRFLPLFRRPFKVYYTFKEKYKKSGKDRRPYSQKFWSTKIFEWMSFYYQNSWLLHYFLFLQFFFFYFLIGPFFAFQFYYRLLVFFFLKIFQHAQPLFFFIFNLISSYINRYFGKIIITFLVMFLNFVVIVSLFGIVRYMSRYAAYFLTTFFYFFMKSYFLVLYYSFIKPWIIIYVFINTLYTQITDLIVDYFSFFFVDLLFFYEYLNFLLLKIIFISNWWIYEISINSYNIENKTSFDYLSLDFTCNVRLDESLSLKENYTNIVNELQILLNNFYVSVSELSILKNLISHLDLNLHSQLNWNVSVLLSIFIFYIFKICIIITSFEPINSLKLFIYSLQQINGSILLLKFKSIILNIYLYQKDVWVNLFVLIKDHTFIKNYWDAWKINSDQLNNNENLNIVFNNQFLQNLIYSYSFLLIICFTLLCSITSFYFYLGRLKQYKLFFNFFFFIFIIASHIQLCYSWYSNTSLLLNFDFQQNYIFFNVFFFSFLFNKLSLYFSTTTIQIAFFINVFSIFYFKNDQKYEKFFLLLNFFVFFMVFFLHSNNFLCLFLFWELIGITSYFLINFYELKNVSFKSAFKTFSFNRFSDVCLLTSLIIYWTSTNTFSIDTNNLLLFFVNHNFIVIFFYEISACTTMLIFLLLAAFCKSAQIGFHFWLPDSMEAPAPASALIHSATLVSAGLFLVLKFSVLYKLFPVIQLIILTFGTLTTLFGAIVSAAQTDLKRLLAYSTISNCGLLFVSSVTSSLEATCHFFYLHGITKSLCFFFVGLLIINFNHNQDVRYIGHIKTIFKIILIYLYTTMSFLSCSLWTPNSFFKHLIFFDFKHNNYLIFLQILLIISSAFSIIYGYKILYVLNDTHIKFTKDSKTDLKINFSIASTIVIFFMVMLLLIFKKFFYFKFFFFNILNLSIQFFFYTFLLWLALLIIWICIELTNDDAEAGLKIKFTILSSVLLLFIL